MAKKKDLDMVSSSAKVKLGVSDIIVRGIGYFVTTLYSLACIFPFLVILGSSFSSESYLNLHGVQLIPGEFSTEAYHAVVKSGLIWRSYIVTILITVTGTVIGLSLIAMTGYALQRKDFPFRNGISFYI